MNEEYAAYLQSDAWKAKRRQRLAISKNRCAACAEPTAVHVHHLTYARIFNEDMADLLPLCELHHAAAEELIKAGELKRNGDVLFLATETIRLILAAAPKAKRNRTGEHETRNPTQQKLCRNPGFLKLLHGERNRKRFKQELRKLCYGSNKVLTNGCVLWDRLHNTTKRKELAREVPMFSVQIISAAPSRSGFRQPRQKWVTLTEEQRHQAAYDRAS